MFFWSLIYSTGTFVLFLAEMHKPEPAGPLKPAIEEYLHFYLIFLF